MTTIQDKEDGYNKWPPSLMAYFNGSMFSTFPRGSNSFTKNTTPSPQNLCGSMKYLTTLKIFHFASHRSIYVGCQRNIKQSFNPKVWVVNTQTSQTLRQLSFWCNMVYKYYSTPA